MLAHASVAAGDSHESIGTVSQRLYEPGRLLGLARADNGENGQHQHLQVEPERPVLDVVVIPLDAVRERRLAAEAVHLRPAGDARLHALAVAVAVDALLEA